MHYCQVCVEPVVMTSEPPLARCPRCGSTERARTAPLFLVTGASGSGKTTIFPHLVDALPDYGVFDVDWLIDPIGRLCGGQPMDWVNFRDTWLAVAHAVAQAGRPTVLLGPFFRAQLDPLPARTWVGPIHVAVLDCADDVRRARLNARPAWRERKIDEHIEFAGHLRAAADIVFGTEKGGPDDVARDVASWVRAQAADRA